MAERTELAEFATDAEIHDLILASQNKLNNKTLGKIAAARGIILSPDESRSEIADYLSSSLRDFPSILSMVNHTASYSRAEKNTTVVVEGIKDRDELDAFARAYKKEFSTREKITVRKTGTDKLIMDIEYKIPDHSKTRLLQTTTKDMRMEFAISGDKVTISMPANSKADVLIGKLEQNMKAGGNCNVSVNRFHLNDLNFSERLFWFTQLFSSIDGFKFHDVLHAKIIRNPSEDDEDIEAEATDTEIEEVRQVTITGKRILAGKLYGSLDKSKFLLTESHFVVENKASPWERFKITVSFENPSDMSGFAYKIWYAARENNAEYSQFVIATAADNVRISTLLLDAAKMVKESIISKDGNTPKKAKKPSEISVNHTNKNDSPSSSLKDVENTADSA